MQYGVYFMLESIKTPYQLQFQMNASKQGIIKPSAEDHLQQ